MPLTHNKINTQNLVKNPGFDDDYWYHILRTEHFVEPY